MRIEKSGSKLMIEADVSAKNTFLYLGVGIVFLIGGPILLSHGGSRSIALLFIGLGVLVLIAFATQLRRVRMTYIFDSATQQLHLSQGQRIPFAAITTVSVHEDTWKGTYGEPHREHSVRLSIEEYGNFSIPVNSYGEAADGVEQIQQHLAAN